VPKKRSSFCIVFPKGEGTLAVVGLLAVEGTCNKTAIASESRRDQREVLLRACPRVAYWQKGSPKFESTNEAKYIERAAKKGVELHRHYLQ
jgi:hypothetical protein